MADISIATIVLPYYLKRDNRLYITGIVQSVLDMGNAVRFNGNGGADSPVNIDDDMVLMAREIANQIEFELEYPGQIKVNVIRESRVTDYAK